MKMKRVIVFFLSMMITWLAILLVVSSFTKNYDHPMSKISQLVKLYSSDKNLKKMLENDDFQLVNDIKIYNEKEYISNQKIVDEIAELTSELTHFIGPIQKTDLNIIVFEELEEMRKYANLENIDAFYSNHYKVMAVVMEEPLITGTLGLDALIREGIEGNLINAIRHEFTHYYVAQYLKESKIKRLPTWFEEGLAEYVTYTIKDNFVTKPKGQVMDYSLLEKKTDWENYRKTSNQLYDQSHFAINYIIENNSESIIKEIIDNSGQIGFEQSFYDSTGIEITDLHHQINLAIH